MAFPLSVIPLSAQAGNTAAHKSAAPKMPDLIIAAPRCYEIPCADFWTNPPASHYSTNPIFDRQSKIPAHHFALVLWHVCTPRERSLLVGRTLLIAKVLFARGILHESSQSIDIRDP
jgi:hypothetical protein